MFHTSKHTQVPRCACYQRWWNCQCPTSVSSHCVGQGHGIAATIYLIGLWSDTILSRSKPWMEVCNYFFPVSEWQIDHIATLSSRAADIYFLSPQTGKDQVVKYLYATVYCALRVKLKVSHFRSRLLVRSNREGGYWPVQSRSRVLVQFQLKRRLLVRSNPEAGC